MDDNLTATAVEDLPMKHSQPLEDQDSAVGKLKEEIIFLRSARYAIYVQASSEARVIFMLALPPPLCPVGW